jgi:hypothetical protein
MDVASIQFGHTSVTDEHATNRTPIFSSRLDTTQQELWRVMGIRVLYLYRRV